MKIRAAVLYDGAAGFSIEQLDLADPREGEARVRVEAVGICHSDWNLVTGDTAHPKPVVTGHEGAGVVEALGPGVNHLKVGDRVALSWAPGCGRCDHCRRGKPALCNTQHDLLWNGFLLDGTTRLSKNGQSIFHYCGLACFADFCVVPAASCVPVPDSMPTQAAALLGCAVTTGVGAVVNTASVEPGSSVAIVGLGGVGMSAVMGAKIAGAARIIGIDRLESRRNRANEFGATEVSDSLTAEGVDYCFDTTGNPTVIERCVEATRPGGTVVLLGLPATDKVVPINAAAFVRNERTLLGSYYGGANPPVDFPRYAKWFAEGKLPIDRMISRTYKLEEINEGYRAMLAGETLRGVIDFSR